MLRSRPSAAAHQGSTQSPFEKEVSDLQARLIRADNARERQQLLDKLFVAEEEVSIAIEQRNRLRAKDVGKPVPLAAIERTLRPDELLIEYVLTEPAAYCLAISRQRARLVQLPAGRKQIDALAADYLAAVKAKRADDEHARKLNDILLRPVSVPSRARLVVVPDGKLHLLPFDSLRDDGGRYVLESHVVTYAPSGTTLQLIRSAHRQNPTLPFIGIGNIAYNDPPPKFRATPPRTVEASTSRGLYDLAGAHFPPLPGTREEVLTSGKIFGKSSVLLLGPNATEAAFKAEPLSKFAIVHVATHGIADPKFPERAALVLGEDATGTDDGLLQSREIIQLPLSADLVTLSACDTGAGRLQGEEGIANLVRAFLLAGAKTVVASTWSADDIFTTALMKQFYQRIVAGQDEGTALQEAKLDLLHKFGDSTPPFYWAGFTMVGDGARRVGLPR
jgi:CHAT domain-containing protein